LNENGRRDLSNMAQQTTDATIVLFDFHTMSIQYWRRIAILISIRYLVTRLVSKQINIYVFYDTAALGITAAVMQH